MLKLRELSRSDLAEINKWRSDKDLIACLGAPYRYIGYEVDEKWFNNYLNYRANNVRCVVVDDEEPEIALCSVSLTDIDWINRSAVFQIMIGSADNRGKGIGSFAITEMINHAFNDLNLNRIELETLESNSTARKFYEKHGFKYEGTKKQAAFKNGHYEDVICMALLNKNLD